MTQINHVFGKTLEFSTTVNHGRIVGQELVSSNEDSLITFRIDGDNFLCPQALRQIAAQIQEAKGSGLSKATAEQADKYIADAKVAVSNMLLFSLQFVTAYLAVAEHTANLDGLTLYDHRVTEIEVTPADIAESSEDPDDYEEDEWGDEDELDPDEEDEWDDEDYDEDECDEDEDEE
jgi:hypothetical protein